MVLPRIDWILKSSSVTHKVESTVWMKMTNCEASVSALIHSKRVCNEVFPSTVLLSQWHAHVHDQQQWLCMWAQANVWKCCFLPEHETSLLSRLPYLQLHFTVCFRIKPFLNSSVSQNYCCVFCVLVLMFCHTVSSYVILFNYDHISSTNKAHRFTSSVCIPPCFQDPVLFGHFF